MSKEPCEMKDIIEEIFTLVGVTNLWYNVPTLHRLDMHGVKRKLRGTEPEKCVHMEADQSKEAKVVTTGIQ